MNRIMRERRKPFVSCLYVGLPPSNLFHNKYETIHAFLGANLSLLVLVERILAVFNVKRTRAQSSIVFSFFERETFSAEVNIKIHQLRNLLPCKSRFLSNQIVNVCFLLYFFQVNVLNYLSNTLSVAYT